MHSISPLNQHDRCAKTDRERPTLVNHDDHVALLRTGITETGGTWADFGSGWGAFTLALADLLGPGAEIYSLDLDRRALERQQTRYATLAFRIP